MQQLCGHRERQRCVGHRNHARLEHDAHAELRSRIVHRERCPQHQRADVRTRDHHAPWQVRRAGTAHVRRGRVSDAQQLTDFSEQKPPCRCSACIRREARGVVPGNRRERIAKELRDARCVRCQWHGPRRRRATGRWCQQAKQCGDALAGVRSAGRQREPLLDLLLDQVRGNAAQAVQNCIGRCQVQHRPRPARTLHTTQREVRRGYAGSIQRQPGLDAVYAQRAQCTEWIRCRERVRCQRAARCGNAQGRGERRQPAHGVRASDRNGDDFGARCKFQLRCIHAGRQRDFRRTHTQSEIEHADTVRLRLECSRRFEDHRNSGQFDTGAPRIGTCAAACGWLDRGVDRLVQQCLPLAEPLLHGSA